MQEFKIYLETKILVTANFHVIKWKIPEKEGFQGETNENKNKMAMRDIRGGCPMESGVAGGQHRSAPPKLRSH